ncbi:saccharopine dehydrogenase NADP-binding domain-containing protein [Solwaraspora sp. WMMD1047]|uniref:saccharopine dehydrogenase family protein n=1 Tax=Solwaraspora sp. WMMD1047 TaxID=3016102 RepID=UPI00241598D8|nr:saccharopine dehydrogenase NADP-binding domain-containing protein [Solwaraspora sp. WMMD1047]MDG4832583.1 saccharopine dehydrogenase NADP-binding domain-containing protein [Solwaraspora sp. WMMD1047]
MADDRPFDLVVFGVTGFTGGLTARYLADHGPAGLRWALAGRNEERLAAVRRELAVVNPACAELPLLRADATDPADVAAVAASTRVVISTVGPFLRFGEPLVAACAAAGTDYVDITGEQEFVDLMYLRHHERAVTSGARLVHACGFDSVPHDLGVYFTVGQLPRDVPLTVDGYVRAAGGFSGGTVHSAASAVARRREAARVARQRRLAEPRPDGRRVRTVPGRPGRAPGQSGWVLPLPTIDPQVVRRSAAALPVYGPDFRYRHFASLRRLPTTLAAVGGVAAIAGLTRIPPARSWLLGRVAPGSGPAAARRARSWFRVRFVGEGGGQRVVTEVSGGDPGYDETAKMVAESALCLAFDELPGTAGQVTTAVAMGDALTGRLIRAGITFRTLS